jgi:hypothetical protein
MSEREQWRQERKQLLGGSLAADPDAWRQFGALDGIQLRWAHRELILERLLDDLIREKKAERMGQPRPSGLLLLP